ncbi:MAG: hypothetical protein U0353_02515 [Sandaracinus sp.]
MELASMGVLVIDAQATAACPSGHLLELGWATLPSGARDQGTERDEPSVRTRLVTLPHGERVPPAVARITGITSGLVASGVSPDEAWRELLADAAALACGAGGLEAMRAVPSVAHFARFERPFLERLAAAIPSDVRLELVCTHEIAVRLFPDLPRRSLRALTGYFGRSVGELRRSAEHVSATAFVWRELVTLLEARGVRTWSALRAWLAEPSSRPKRGKRGWPMPRELRLSLPDRPGLYRMLRTSGDVLYVGKATSLHTRVNSYFRKQRGVHERTLEMLSQARGLSYVVTESPLEAALLEPDEIKRHRPPYNEALTEVDRAVWFATNDLAAWGPRATPELRVGPFSSSVLLERFAALVRREPTAVAPARWAPSTEDFEAGLARLTRTHAELATGPSSGLAAPTLLRLGARLWREGRRLRDESDEGATPSSDVPLLAHVWTDEAVAAELESLVLACAHAVRRARWLSALVESSIVWREPGASTRLLVITGGEIARREDATDEAEPPVPEGHRRSRAARQEAFSVARFDRLRVLGTELKRLVGKDLPVSVRLAPRLVLSGARLGRVLAWL